jgi:hypothetical protein
MLAELTDELKREPDPLYDHGVRVRPITTKTDPDERYLRTWEGRIYVSAPDDDDDEPEDEPAEEEGDDEDAKKPRRDIVLVSGGDLAFVKVVLYHRDEEGAEAHVLCGALRKVRIQAPVSEFSVPRWQFRRLLSLVTDDAPTKTYRTKARVRRPANLPRKARLDRDQYSLIFDLDASPARYRLYDINGREKVREIAAEVKRRASI